MMRAGLERIKRRLERLRATEPERPFDADAFDLFAEEEERPKRWTDEEVRAWKAFEQTNLDPLSGRFCTARALEDIVKFPGAGRTLTLFFENRMRGTSRAILRGCGEECFLLFEGRHTRHHHEDSRGFVLKKGYDAGMYYQFIQALIEAYFGLAAGTLVPKPVSILGEPVPLCVRLEWPQRGIYFCVECDTALSDVEDAALRTSSDRWFDIFARWHVRTGALG